ncbi:MAG: hypothetical protein DRR08_28715, partial [Candidatus Parabeggiatoa sp. nov. 2]
FHLDLKPANILLSLPKKSDVSKTSDFEVSKTADFSDISVKIIDFGLAKVAPSLGQEMATQRSRSGLSLLAQAAVFGTMDYAPPEQQGVTSCGKPSAKSDVYAFGKTLYRLLTEESPQTFLQRRLAEAPELFELLSDCVEIEPEKRIDVATLISRLTRLLRQIYQPPPPQPIKQPPSPQPVEKTIQPEEQPRIVQVDKRKWWNQLDDNWKKVFKRKISIDGEPTDSDLEKIVNLHYLDCSENQISDLEPLHANHKKLQTLYCENNQISDLEPLRAMTNLQTLNCSSNEISDLEPLRAVTNLQTLNCSSNQISDLKPLHANKKLQVLDCRQNKISDLEPLRAFTNLQELVCDENQISDLEPLRAVTNLQILNCEKNQISDLEPLHAVTKLQVLDCRQNKISDLELDKFKKAVPNCKVRKSWWW